MSLSEVWHFLSAEENRTALSWMGSGLAAIAAGLWAAFTYVFPRERRSPTTYEAGRSLSASERDLLQARAEISTARTSLAVHAAELEASIKNRKTRDKFREYSTLCGRMAHSMYFPATLTGIVRTYENYEMKPDSLAISEISRGAREYIDWLSGLDAELQKLGPIHLGGKNYFSAVRWVVATREACRQILRAVAEEGSDCWPEIVKVSDAIRSSQSEFAGILEQFQMIARPEASAS